MRTWEQRLKILTALLQLLSTAECLAPEENIAERSFFSGSPSNENLYSFRYDLIDEAVVKSKPLESNPFHKIYSKKGKDGEDQRIHYAADEKGLRANFYSNAFQVSQNHFPDAPQTPLLWPVRSNAGQFTFVGGIPVSFPHVSEPGLMPNIRSQNNAESSNFQNTQRWIKSLSPSENTGTQNAKFDNEKLYDNKLPYVSEPGLMPNIRSQNNAESSNLQNAQRWIKSLSPSENTRTQNAKFDNEKLYENKLPLSFKTISQNHDVVDPLQTYFLNSHRPTTSVINDAQEHANIHHKTKNMKFLKELPIISLQDSTMVKISDEDHPKVLYENTIGDILRIPQPHELPSGGNERVLNDLKLREKSVDYNPPTPAALSPESISFVTNNDKISNFPLNAEKVNESNGASKSILKKENNINAVPSQMIKSSSPVKSTQLGIPQSKKMQVPSFYQNLKLTEKQKKLLSNVEKLQSKSSSPMSTVFDISNHNGRYYHYILNMGSSSDKKFTRKDRYFSTGDALLKLLKEAGISYKNEDSEVSNGQNRQIVNENLKNVSANTFNIRRIEYKPITTPATEHSERNNKTQYDINFNAIPVKGKMKKSRKQNNLNITNRVTNNAGSLLKSIESSSEAEVPSTAKTINTQIEFTTYSPPTEMDNENNIIPDGILKSVESNTDNSTETNPLYLTMPKSPLNMLFVPVTLLLTTPSPEYQKSNITKMPTTFFLPSSEAYSTNETRLELTEATTTKVTELNQANSENADNDRLFTQVETSTPTSTTLAELGTSVIINTTTEQEIVATSTEPTISEIRSSVVTVDPTESATSEVTSSFALVDPTVSNFSGDDMQEDTLESPFAKRQVANITHENSKTENSTFDINNENIPHTAKDESTKFTSSINGDKILNATNPVIVIKISNIYDLMPSTIDLSPELAAEFRNESSESLETEESTKGSAKNISDKASASSNFTKASENKSNMVKDVLISTPILQSAERGRIKNLVKSGKNEMNETNKNSIVLTPTIYQNDLSKKPKKKLKTKNGINNDKFQFIETDPPQTEYSLIHPLLLEDSVDRFLQISPNGIYSILEVPTDLQMVYEKPDSLESTFVQYLLNNRDSSLTHKKKLLSFVTPSKLQYILSKPEFTQNSNEIVTLLPDTDYDFRKSKHDLIPKNELDVSSGNVNTLKYTLLMPESFYNDSNSRETLLGQSEIFHYPENPNEVQYVLIRPEMTQNSNDGNKDFSIIYEPNDSNNKIRYQNKEYYLINDMVNHSPYQANTSDPDFVPEQLDIQYISEDSTPKYQQTPQFSREHNSIPTENETVEQILLDSFNAKYNIDDSNYLTYQNAFSDILRLNLSNNQSPPRSDVQIVDYVPVESTRNNKAVNIIPDNSNNYLKEPIFVFEEYTEVPNYGQSNRRDIRNDGTSIQNAYSPLTYPDEENAFQAQPESSTVFGSKIQKAIQSDHANGRYVSSQSTFDKFIPNLIGSSSLSQAPWIE